MCLYSSTKKIEKDFDDFWRRKLTLKVKFWHYLTPSYSLHQPSKFNNFLLSMLILRQKSFKFYAPCLITRQPILSYWADRHISEIRKGWHLLLCIKRCFLATLLLFVTISTFHNSLFSFSQNWPFNFYTY